MDGPEELLEGAHKRVLDLAKQKAAKEAGARGSPPRKSALVYEGAIQLLKEGGYEDAQKA